MAGSTFCVAKTAISALSKMAATSYCVYWALKISGANNCIMRTGFMIYSYPSINMQI